MTSKTSELISGRMRLHSVETDGFKMSRFSLNFIEKSDKRTSPLTKLMLAVMLRGSEKYPTITKINKALDEQYGAAVSFRSTTVGDKTVHKISSKLLKDKYAFEGDNTDILENVMAILSDILLHPLTDENGLLLSSYVESEKKIAIDQINAKINDPKAYASEQCSKKMFEGSRYSVVLDGNSDIIESFTPSELTANIRRFFSECRVECYYIGNKSHERIKSLVEKYFPFEDTGKCGAIYSETAFCGQGNGIKYVDEDADVSQGRLVLGYRCNTVLSDKNYYAMALFNEIFGGASVSKLFMNVREKKSLCYYCYSSFHTSTGTIKVGCGIDPLKKDEALAEIAVQLDAMKQGDFSHEEIETAKHTLTAGVKQITDSPASIEAFMLRRLLANVDEDLDACAERINDVTKEDILAAAEKVELDTVYFLNGSDIYEGDGEDE